MPRLLSLSMAFWFASAAVAPAQALDKELGDLASKLTKALVVQGAKNVAATDFTDLQGQPTELGRFLSEQLEVQMVLAGGVSLLDRANIKAILAEHKLTEEGLVNPANAKKLGQFAGVDAILIGNVATLDGVVLTVKAISTDSARILAAGRATFPKTADIQLLLNRSVSSARAPSSRPSGEPSYQQSNAIAVKDFGAVRVELKSVMPTTLTDRWGAGLSGITCSFEFTSRETQKSLIVAVNAETRDQHSEATSLRASLTDDRGGVWGLSSQHVSGLGFLRGGVHGRNKDPYSPSEIVRLVRLRDELGRDIDDPSDGTTDGAGFTTGYPRPGEPPQTFFLYRNNQFISGSPTTIEPGQSVTVTMTFLQGQRGMGQGSRPAYFQLAAELVIGVGAADARKTYTLQNLIFDRVNLGAGGSR